MSSVSWREDEVGDSDCFYVNYFSVWSWLKFDGENWYIVLVDV